MNSSQEYQECIRRFFLVAFEIKVKLATVNSDTMAKQLEYYINNYASLTPESFGNFLKEKLPKDEIISSETIRGIIRKAKENKPFAISTDRTSIFLKLLNIISDDKIKNENNYSLKNKLALDFYKYPGDDVLIKYIIDNKLHDSFTADSLLEYIIAKHDEISTKLCKKLEPRVIHKELVITGKIFKKYEWHTRVSDNLLEQQSILNDPDFDESFLPKNISEIFIALDDVIIDFIKNHIRFLRLISNLDAKNFAEELGIKDTSLIQYETTPKKKLNDSIICKLVDHFSKEQDKKTRQLFDFFFTEITWPAFSTDCELREKFSALIDDYTFLRYIKYQHDKPDDKPKSNKEVSRPDVRQKTIDLLEIEIKYFVFKTISESSNLQNIFLPEVQIIFER